MKNHVVDAYLDELLVDLDAMEQAGGAAPVAMPAAAVTAVATPEPAPAAPVASPAPPPAPEPVPMSFAPTPTATVPVAPVPVPVLRPVPVPHDGHDATPRPRAAATSRWLRVGIGTDHYAFELLRVQEVVRIAPIVAMRGAAPSVLGVMNLRGRIVPVFDLGRWLGSADVVTTEHSRIVVVEREDELIGVLVTRVEDVATLGREHIEPPLIGSDAGAIVGIARVGRSPTVLLDANALFD